MSHGDNVGCFFVRRATSFRRRCSTSAWWLAASLLACLLAGCGDQKNTARVSGRVTYDGQPLDDGTISFRPAAGTKGPEFSAPVKDGQFRVAAPQLPGKYAVEISAWRKTGRMIKGQFDQQIEETLPALPERYRGAGTELSAQLSAGENPLDFQLQP